MEIPKPTPGTVITIIVFDIVLILAYLLSAPLFGKCVDINCPANTAQLVFVIIGALITAFLLISILAFILEAREKYKNRDIRGENESQE